MSQTSVADQAPAIRVRLAHHVVTLDDGHQVGVSVGGRGVPLVFLHGLGLSGRAYVRLLSRLAGMGFLVVALDAAGHGGTPNLPRNTAELAHRVDLTLRTLDALGIDKAVFMGHSMGGRMIISLAATAPERVLAAVLLDAAAGAPFDDSIRLPVRSPRRAVRALLGVAYDAHGDPLQLPAPERNRYLRMMTSAWARGIHGCVTCWADGLLSDDSPLRRRGDGPLDIVGTEARERVSLDHLRAGPCRAPKPERRKSFGGRRGWLRTRRRVA